MPREHASHMDRSTMTRVCRQIMHWSMASFSTMAPSSTEIHARHRGQRPVPPAWSHRSTTQSWQKRVVEPSCVPQQGSAAKSVDSKQMAHVTASSRAAMPKGEARRRRSQTERGAASTLPDGGPGRLPALILADSTKDAEAADDGEMT